jgi:hypothetical protein
MLSDALQYRTDDLENKGHPGTVRAPTGQSSAVHGGDNKRAKYRRRTKGSGRIATSGTAIKGVI